MRKGWHRQNRLRLPSFLRETYCPLEGVSQHQNNSKQGEGQAAERVD